MKKAHLFWPLATSIVLADCASKRAIESSLDPGQGISIIGEYVRFTLGYNTGIAFGIPFGIGARPLLIVFTLIACAGIVWIYRSTDAKQWLQIGALGLIMGGAVGNLLDRAFRDGDGFLGGRVVDFVDLQWWPVFNLADASLWVGIVILVAATLREPAPG